MKRISMLVLTVLLFLGGVGHAGASPAATNSAATSEVSATSERAAAIPRLRVPKLGINGAGIIPVGINGRGQLAVGPSVTATYTWKHGVRPGRPGSAVIAGHTWSKGPGVFDNLGTLAAGDRVSVGRADFRVTRVRKVRGLSQRQVRNIFSDRGRARLVLITCGDRSSTTGVYATRILVYADKVRPKRSR